jgi:hypothetical protein
MYTMLGNTVHFSLQTRQFSSRIASFLEFLQPPPVTGCNIRKIWASSRALSEMEDVRLESETVVTQLLRKLVEEKEIKIHRNWSATLSH